MDRTLYGYMLVMALVTYLIRVLPLTLIRKEIKNPFIRSFLNFVPYVTLSAMTFPAILSATGSVYSGLAALIVALILALKGRSLITVAIGACAVVFIVELVMKGFL